MAAIDENGSGGSDIEAAGEGRGVCGVLRRGAPNAADIRVADPDE